MYLTLFNIYLIPDSKKNTVWKFKYFPFLRNCFDEKFTFPQFAILSRQKNYVSAICEIVSTKNLRFRNLRIVPTKNLRFRNLRNCPDKKITFPQFAKLSRQKILRFLNLQNCPNKNFIFSQFAKLSRQKICISTIWEIVLTKNLCFRNLRNCLDKNFTFSQFAKLPRRKICVFAICDIVRQKIYVSAICKIVPTKILRFHNLQNCLDEKFAFSQFAILSRQKK
jgi:hypothetical protein